MFLILTFLCPSTTLILSRDAVLKLYSWSYCVLNHVIWPGQYFWYLIFCVTHIPMLSQEFILELYPHDLTPHGLNNHFISSSDYLSFWYLSNTSDTYLSVSLAYINAIAWCCILMTLLKKSCHFTQQIISEFFVSLTDAVTRCHT